MQPAAQMRRVMGLLWTQMVNGEDNAPFVSSIQRKWTKSDIIWVQYRSGAEDALRALHVRQQQRARCMGASALLATNRSIICLAAAIF
jgi:hypothetical protein